ncbi:MAG TPA: hypothetical protein VMV90_11550 [Rectinemataceae bacterium]|nr:hypothetical protein [Rectinemataceae bacterium]
MNRRLLWAFAAGFAVLASCATVPAAQPKAPSWTSSIPAPDATNTYFVGYASDSGGNVANATTAAASNLLSSIMQYIGVKISVNTSATAKATLDSYSADVTSTVTQSSTNRLAGFSIKDRYVWRDSKSAQVVVYVLAAYATADLDKEKARIAAVFQEKLDAVAKPEAEGRALLASGRYYDAVRKFVEAAVAASGADIDNADIKMERNVNEARTALSKIHFADTGAALVKALVSQPFATPFTVRLVAGEGGSAQGVPGAALKVSYQRRQGTRLLSRTESAVTGADGSLSFTPPPPDFVGKAKLVVRLDLQSSIDLLDQLPSRFGAYRDSLEQDISGKYIEIPYEVSSNARNVSMGIALVDTDESGAPVSGGTTQAGLLDTLTRQKFKVRGADLPPSLVLSMDDAAIQAAAAGKFQRLAYGVARVASVSQDGSTFIATVRGTLKVVDLSNGTVLYSAEKVGTGLGSDKATAVQAAFTQLGRKALGEDLLSTLP